MMIKDIEIYVCLCMYLSVCVCMTKSIKSIPNRDCSWFWAVALSSAGGNINANTQNVILEVIFLFRLDDAPMHKAQNTEHLTSALQVTDSNPLYVTVK